MIYLLDKDRLNLKDGGIEYGFMDGSVDFSPVNSPARKELLNIISTDLKESVYYLYEVKQSHGVNVNVLGEKFKETVRAGYNVFDADDADGVFTGERGVALCVRTADCVPVLFAAGIKGKGRADSVIGAVHCGWKGAYGGIIKNAKDILTDKFKTDVSAVSAIIGPSICKNCYEVQEDFFNLFLTKKISNKRFFEQNADKCKTFFDLKAFIKNELILCGFGNGNIYDIDKCTFEDAGFFSYRRDKTDKRQVSFIVMADI